MAASLRSGPCSPASLCHEPGRGIFESDRYVTAGVSGLETHTYICIIDFRKIHKVSLLVNLVVLKRTVCV